MEVLLDELFQLRCIETKDKLNKAQSKRYLEIYEILNRNHIEIPFGIEV